VADVRELVDRHAGAQLAQALEDVRGRDRVLEAPGEREVSGPVAEGAVPAVGEALALAHVGDRPVGDAPAAVVGEETPLVRGLLAAEWVAPGEDPGELAAERPLAGQGGEQRAEGAAQQLLPGGGAGALLEDAAVEQQRSGDLDLELAAQIARHQLGGDRGAHVVGDQEHGLETGAADQRLGGVGLPAEGVGVVHRLVREAEAEAVEGQRPLPRPQVEELPPVVGAGGEAVEEEQRRPRFAGPLVHVEPAAGDLDQLAGGPPPFDAGRQHP
jgi:hypothetical protein